MTKCKGCHKCRYGFTGAGVLLIDLMRNQIILVRVNGKYTDPGGSIDYQSDTLSYTAARELNEETSENVSTTPQYLANNPYVDISAGTSHKYRCFMLYDSGISCREFYKNRKRLEQLRKRGLSMPYGYYEADRMTRFPISQFKKYKNANAANTDTGRPVVLSNRVVKIISAAVKSGMI